MLKRIRQEFQCTSFSLNYDRPLDFAIWSWTKRPDRVCGYYVTYRCILAAFFLSILVTSGTLSPHPEYWFVYLTNLGFLLQSLHLIVSAAVPIQLLLQSQRKKIQIQITSLAKISWFLYNVTTLTTLVISVAYWGFLFPSRSSTLQPVDFLVHGVNLIVSMSDLFISKRPYRILHFFHPLAFLTAYVAFSAIYWAAGERNEDGLPYIYVFLDWENLEFTVAFVTIGLFILLPLIHFLLWGLHCLRDFICGSGSTTRSANTDEGHVNQVFSDEMYS